MAAFVLKRFDGTQYWVIHQAVMGLRAVVFAINFIQVLIRLFIIQYRRYGRLPLMAIILLHFSILLAIQVTVCTITLSGYII
ncbi:hypothetical protein M2387_002263 [Klebsiella sp. BIGb0407]|nr:hypothetical protein [Klebsiella sp. BIGb0407]